MTWNGSLGIDYRIDKDGVAISFAFQTATITLKIGD
jgi:hypothetical protein